MLLLARQLDTGSYGRYRVRALVVSDQMFEDFLGIKIQDTEGI